MNDENLNVRNFVDPGVLHGTFTFPEHLKTSPERKSFSVIAMNLETAEDVDVVIQQCEAIKKKISDTPKWSGVRYADYMSQKNREV